MSKNLTTGGFINPQQLPLEQVCLEVAALLKVTLKQIERLELWPHQIWVKFVEGRGKFISYRRLPLWVEQGIAAINNCRDHTSLKLLAEALSVERDWYQDSNDSELLQQWDLTISLWREAWGQRSQEITTEEEQLKPLRAHQQAASNWLQAWQQVLHFCSDCDSLNRLATEIEQQSHEFADLPEIMAALRQILQQRWLELSHTKVADAV
ncbi:MAG: hypothetical protein F6K16_02220 [Symploca sp. SIO2B6]|nr:hypothetical protein [Symploca sp. SIO2B6]